MRLLVDGFLDFDFGRGIAKLALELIPGLLEFPEALAKTAGELGKLFCAEEQHHNDKNEDSFRQAGHAQGDWKIHQGKVQRISGLAIYRVTSRQ